MMKSDQPAGSQGTSPNIHRAFCDLILEADETEVDRVIVAFGRNPQQLAAESRHAVEVALTTLPTPATTNLVPMPGAPSPPRDADRKGFGRLVQMFRRRDGLSIPELAGKADVSADELHRIEEQPGHLPKPRTLFQLERFFGLAPDSLGRLSGAIVDTGAEDDASARMLRFAACADGIGRLTREEKHVLAQFVSYLARRR